MNEIKPPLENDSNGGAKGGKFAKANSRGLEVNTAILAAEKLGADRQVRAWTPSKLDMFFERDD
jgi:hypothetical protein